jgi:hypothetical protein
VPEGRLDGGAVEQEVRAPLPRIEQTVGIHLSPSLRPLRPSG